MAEQLIQLQQKISVLEDRLFQLEVKKAKKVLRPKQEKDQECPICKKLYTKTGLKKHTSGCKVKLDSVDEVVKKLKKKVKEEEGE